MFYSWLSVRAANEILVRASVLFLVSSGYRSCGCDTKIRRVYCVISTGIGEERAKGQGSVPAQSGRQLGGRGGPLLKVQHLHTSRQVMCDAGHRVHRGYLLYE